MNKTVILLLSLYCLICATHCFVVDQEHQMEIKIREYLTYAIETLKDMRDQTQTHSRLLQSPSEVQKKQSKHIKCQSFCSYMNCTRCACTEDSCDLCYIEGNQQICQQCNGQTCKICTDGDCICLAAYYQNPLKVKQETRGDCPPSSQTPELRKKVQNLSNKYGAFLQIKDLANSTTNYKVASQSYSPSNFCQRYCADFQGGCSKCGCTSFGFCESCINKEGHDICSKCNLNTFYGPLACDTCVDCQCFYFDGLTGYVTFTNNTCSVVSQRAQKRYERFTTGSSDSSNPQNLNSQNQQQPNGQIKSQTQSQNNQAGRQVSPVLPILTNTSQASSSNNTSQASSSNNASQASSSSNTSQASSSSNTSQASSSNNISQTSSNNTSRTTLSSQTQNNQNQTSTIIQKQSTITRTQTSNEVTFCNSMCGTGKCSTCSCNNSESQCRYCLDVDNVGCSTCQINPIVCVSCYNCVCFRCDEFQKCESYPNPTCV